MPAGLQSWMSVNPCDHDVRRPYYIGELTDAAMNCTDVCPTTTYPDNAQVCHACPVVGCATCSRIGCKDCLIFHMKVDDQCVFLFGALFAAIFLFVACFLLCGILRFCCFSLMSPRNPGVLKEALIHRRRSKVHDYSLPGNPFLDFDDTNVRRQNVSGVAITLYFRFITFCFMLGSVVLLGLVIRYFLPQMVAPEDLPVTQALQIFVLYLLCLVLTARWMWTQNQVVKRDIEEEPHLRNYALVAEGFPKSSRSPHEVKAFFESILGFEIEGVSIAYDHMEELDFIEDRIQRTVEKADCHLGVYPAELSGLESHIGDSQDGYVLDCLMNSGYVFVVFSREEDREFCMRRFAEIERQLKIGGGGGMDEDEGEDSDEEGVVLHALNKRKAGGGASRAVLFRGKFPIRVGHAPEPCGIQWKNFTVLRGAKVVRVAVTFAVAMLSVLVTSSVMFAPSVLYEMSYVNITKPTRLQWQMASWEMALVTVSIAVGNRVIGRGIAQAVEFAGFLQKVNEDSVVASCASCVLLLNSTALLIIASVVALTENTTITTPLTVQIIFQIMWLCMATAEAAKWLLPGWNYFTSYFRVRQSKYMSVREAEPLLTPGSLELPLRYVDLLIPLSLSLSMLSLDPSSLYSIGGMALFCVYAVYVYFMDKYMLLRYNRHTHYTSPKLESTVHFLLVVPFTIFSVAPLGAMGSYFGLDLLPGGNVLVFIANLLLFISLARTAQKSNEPARELTDVPYVEVASLAPYNYFNTNYVHTLRALHFPSIVVPPIYPYASGKEYLQGGQFADYDDSVRLRETLMLLVKNPLKGVEDLGNPQTDF